MSKRVTNMPGYKKQGKSIEPVSFGRGFMQEIMQQNDAPPRQKFKVKCADCGKMTEVPFKPAGDRPVYCKECYMKRRPPRRD